MVTHAGGLFVIDATLTRASMRARRRRVHRRRDERADRSSRKSRLVAARGNDVGNNANAIKFERTLLDR